MYCPCNGSVFKYVVTKDLKEVLMFFLFNEFCRVDFACTDVNVRAIPTKTAKADSTLNPW